MIINDYDENCTYESLIPEIYSLSLVPVALHVGLSRQLFCGTAGNPAQ